MRARARGSASLVFCFGKQPLGTTNCNSNDKAFLQQKFDVGLDTGAMLHVDLLNLTKSMHQDLMGHIDQECHKQIRWCMPESQVKKKQPQSC